MVEDAVEGDPQAAGVRLGDQAVEVGVVAEPRVDPEVVDGVVAVRFGGEDGTEQEPVAAQVDRVVEPILQLWQAMHDRRLRCRRGPGEAERVDLPPDRVIRPHDASSVPE